MKRAQDARPFLPSLLIGDMLTVLLFVALGMTSHLTWNGALSLFPASFPFLLAWLVWGAALGAFRAGTIRNVRTAIRTAVIGWALAAPTGVFVRMLMLGRAPHWTFWLTSFGFGVIMLAAWRVGAAWYAARSGVR